MKRSRGCVNQRVLILAIALSLSLACKTAGQLFPIPTSLPTYTPNPISTLSPQPTPRSTATPSPSATPEPTVTVTPTVTPIPTPTLALPLLNSTSLPTGSAPITAENAGRMVELARWGWGKTLRIAWSPDRRWLAHRGWWKSTSG